MAVAYSYVRFSTAKQAGGDSLRRQSEASTVYAREHDLELSVSSYRDLGVSGYDRSNMERGALRAFIDAVNSGVIAKGSYLLIEQFDRMSRAEVSVALKLLLDLVGAGITVITLDDGKVWDSNTVNDVGELITSIIFMSRAHGESKAKATRLRATWQEKKRRAVADGEILTLECPRWLKVASDRSHFIVLEEKAQSVRKVFLARAKGLGATAIARMANEEKWACPGSGIEWHTSLIGRLLINQAVLGHYVPHDVKSRKRTPAVEAGVGYGYYPAIVDQATYDAAQNVTVRHRTFPSRRDINYRNFLQGLLRCECGRTFGRKNQSSAKQPGYSRYYCSGRRTGATKCKSVSTSSLEGAILNAIVSYAPANFSFDEKAAAIRDEIDALKLEEHKTLARLQRYVTAMGESEVPLKTLTVKMAEDERKLEAIARSLIEKSVQLDDLKLGDSDLIFTAVKRLSGTTASAPDRAELRENLMRVVNDCVVFATDGYIGISFRAEPGLRVAVPLRSDAFMPGVTTMRGKATPAQRA